MPNRPPKPSGSALFTDLYELTMAAVYFERGMHEPATFSFFVRAYPPNRGYFVAAGLEEVLEYLETFRFTREELAYLRSTGLFSRDFLRFLASVRFEGDVFAMPEGTVFFVDEPVLEITAPLIQGQIVETFVINQLHLGTLLATKAARCVDAARGRRVVDFSPRRTHGTDAGMKAARASYLAGAAGTSNVLAGKRWGIPVFGTMAHSFVEVFPHEVEAFRAFSEVFPDASVFLVDTYDTLAGVRSAVRVARSMAERGKLPRAIRLDSGNLEELSREARRILDENGLENVQIFASGGLDEFEIDRLVSSGAPIDGFGVGTRLGVSEDAPALDCAYKLVEYAGSGRVKLSAKKKTWVGRKQVWRVCEGGRAVTDCLALRDEPRAEIASYLQVPEERLEPLLRPFVRGGRRVEPPAPLSASRERFREELARVALEYRRIREPALYPVRISPALAAAQKRATEEARARTSSGLPAP